MSTIADRGMAIIDIIAGTMVVAVRGAQSTRSVLLDRIDLDLLDASR